jgi:DNA-binding CsgD family transcriptional regulator
VFDDDSAPRDTRGVRLALNWLSETFPEARVQIKAASLRSQVVEVLTLGGARIVEPDAKRERGDHHPGAVLVCDASHLTRGAARGRRSRCVAVVPGQDSDEARRALAAGAMGIVFAQDLTALVATVAAVAAGQLVIPGSLRTAVAKPVLTTREKQVMALVVMGFTNREIADQLFLAESTVKSHLFSAFRRLGVRTRKEATALILDGEQGLGQGILTITQ